MIESLRLVLKKENSYNVNRVVFEARFQLETTPPRAAIIQKKNREQNAFYSTLPHTRKPKGTHFNNKK